MANSSPEVLVGHIAVLVQFAKYMPDAFEHRSDVIMAFLLKKILMVPSLPDPVCRTSLSSREHV